jgi:hypothetical protein
LLILFLGKRVAPSLALLSLLVEQSTKCVVETYLRIDLDDGCCRNLCSISEEGGATQTNSFDTGILIATIFYPLHTLAPLSLLAPQRRATPSSRPTRDPISTTVAVATFARSAGVVETCPRIDLDLLGYRAKQRSCVVEIRSAGVAPTIGSIKINLACININHNLNHNLNHNYSSK